MSDTTTVPDPQAGGRYVRNPDDSLTQIHKTEEAPAVGSAPAAPAAPAPAPAAPSTAQE